MPVHIYKLVFNPFSVNTYVIWDDSKQCMVIDPGCSNNDEQSYLKDFINENDLKPKYLVNTHCHIDHIIGNAFIKEQFLTKFVAPEKDLFLLNMMLDQASMFGMKADKSPEPDILMTEEFSPDLPFRVQFLFTPGHTPGEFCINVPEAKFCITGDVLFRDSIGRVDLWGGDYDTLIESINTKLMTLPDDTIIYPGHGEESTIGYERQNNSYLSI